MKKLTKTERRIVDVLRRAPETSMHRDRIAGLAGMNLGALSCYLSNLTEAGTIVRVRAGFYGLPERQPPRPRIAAPEPDPLPRVRIVSRGDLQAIGDGENAAACTPVAALPSTLKPIPLSRLMGGR